MPYIDATYYNDTYNGKGAEDAALAVFLDRATDIIDQITGYKIVHAGGLATYSEFIQGQVRKATAAQTEFLIMSGDAAANTGAMPASVSIGSFSYSKGGAQSEAGSAGRTSPAVLAYLQPTGLLYSGVDVRAGYYEY